MIFIKDFCDGDLVSGVYICKTRTTGITKTGKEYDSCLLQDKTGTIDAKIWDLTSPGIREFNVNDFVYVKGRINVYNNVKQLKIDQIQKAEEGSYKIEDYMPKSRFNVSFLVDELNQMIDSVSNVGLKKLLNHFYKEDKEFFNIFIKASAAKSVHHAVAGGLLEHSISLAKLCDKIASNYDYVNRDILITAALLHDIGKTRELSSFPENDYTEEGNFIGHLVIGYSMVKEASAKIEEISELLALQIEHCILSHHGQLEYGSPKKPATIEAFILATADKLDAHLEIFRTKIFDPNNSNPWLGYDRLLEVNIRKTEI